MGTLFEQRPRSSFIFDGWPLAEGVDQFKVICHNLTVAVSDLEMPSLTTDELFQLAIKIRQIDLDQQHRDTVDEQLKGFGEILRDLATSTWRT